MQNSLTVRTPSKSSITETAKHLVISKTGMTEREYAQYEALVSIELFKLRTAYPTQSRNYSETETDALTALWLEVFADTDPKVLHEAVIRFIKTDTDRAAFFPSPGQIMKQVEIIKKEISDREQDEENYRHVKKLLERLRNKN